MKCESKRVVPTWLVAWGACLSPFVLIATTNWMGLEAFGGVEWYPYDPSGVRFFLAFCVTMFVGFGGATAAGITAIRTRFPYYLLYCLIALANLIPAIVILYSVVEVIISRMW